MGRRGKQGGRGRAEFWISQEREEGGDKFQKRKRVRKGS